MRQTETVRYFVEIDNVGGDYTAKIHRGNRANAQSVAGLQLGAEADIPIKGRSFKLGALIQALIQFEKCDLELAYDDRGQLEIGGYLYAQTLGRLGQDERKRLDNASKVEVYIVTQDEYIARLPWMLLVNNGVFLSTTGWSVTLSTTTECGDYELPPSPKILVVAPQPEGVEDTDANSHLETLEDLLSNADPRHSLGQNLRVAYTWVEFRRQITEFQPHIVYYYGHGVGDQHTSRLLFATERTNRRLSKPIADFANILRKLPDGHIRLVYLNCCHGDTGGLLGAGRQLGGFIPAVVTNRTVARIDAAQAQALAFWRSVLLDGTPPHTAVARMYANLGDLDLSLADVRWMTPVLHCHYANWKSNPPKRVNREDRDPHWRLKLDRVSQFSRVFYLTDQMLRERRPRSLAYVWYGQEGQGVDLFHKRLTVELQEKLTGTFLYEVRPDWPMDLHNPHRSFQDMFTEAFGVSDFEQIPGRIRTQTRGVSGRQTLVYVRHRPVRSSKLINPKSLKTYLQWWDCEFAPLLEGQTFALLGISFAVSSPYKFSQSMMEARVEGLELDATMFHLLDEMDRLVKRDLLDFLQTHNIRLPIERRDQVLEKILERTDGQYEMTLEELKDLEAHTYEIDDEVIETRSADDGFDY